MESHVPGDGHLVCWLVVARAHEIGLLLISFRTISGMHVTQYLIFTLLILSPCNKVGEHFSIGMGSYKALVVAHGGSSCMVPRLPTGGGRLRRPRRPGAAVPGAWSGAGGSDHRCQPTGEPREAVPLGMATRGFRCPLKDCGYEKVDIFIEFVACGCLPRFDSSFLA